MDDPFANSRKMVEYLQSEIRRYESERDLRLAEYEGRPEAQSYIVQQCAHMVATMARDIIYYRSNMPPYITDEGNGMWFKHPVLEPINPMEPVPAYSPSLASSTRRRAE